MRYGLTTAGLGKEGAASHVLFCALFLYDLF